MPSNNLDSPNQAMTDSLRAIDLPETTKSSNLLGLWLGVNIVGFAIATPLSLLMTLSTRYFETLYIAGFIVGAIIGPLQALVIKRQVPKLKSWQWILANIFGSYLGSWAGLLGFGAVILVAQSFNSSATLDSLLGKVFTFATYGATVGVFASAAQLSTLRDHTQGLRQWWIANFLGRTLGWLCAGLLGWTISSAASTTTDPKFLVILGAPLGAIGGAIYAGATVKALLNFKPQSPAP